MDRATLSWFLAASLAVLAMGCDDRSKTFAVTLLDAPKIACYGYAQGLLADPEDLEDKAKAIKRDWKDERLVDPPAPVPRILRINELETRMQAWFDDGPVISIDTTTTDGGLEGGVFDAGSSEGGSDAGGSPSQLAEQQLPFIYDAQGVVYEGELHDDYMEGSYFEYTDTDAADDQSGLYLCGRRARAKGVLSVTTSGGLLGRIRWTHYVWVASEFTACEGYIECSRDITMEGLEVE